MKPPSRSGSDLEAGLQWAKEGLKLRSCRASCQDFQLITCGAEERPYWEKAKPSACNAVGSSGGSAAGSGRSSPRASAVAAAARRSWRRILSALLALVLCSVLVARHRSLYRTGQNAVADVYYRLDPFMLGRSEARHPAPHCCVDEGCMAPRDGTARLAVVTYLRGDAYAPLMQQLECSLRRSNPGLELALMHVPGELSEATLGLARHLNITLIPVQPLDFPNSYESRYGRNWLKVRALGLTQYHSVLLVDSDVVVAGSLDALFHMPVEAAAVWDQSKWLNRFRTRLDRINGGLLLLRPCAAVEVHMLQLLEAHPKLRFVYGTAEQDFFGWYYRYTAATLPVHWNCQAEQCLVGNLTVGGMPPKVVHFTKNKPFKGPQPGGLGHEFLCPLDELNRRAVMGSMLPPHSAAADAAATPAAVPAAAGELGAERQEAAGEQQQQQQAAAGEQQQQQQAAAAGEQQQQQQQQAAVDPAPAADNGAGIAGQQAAEQLPEQGQPGEPAAKQQQQEQQLSEQVGVQAASGQAVQLPGAGILPERSIASEPAARSADILQQGDKQLPR